MPVKKSGRVRIDGGKWRGRYLSFDSTQTIRPSKSIVKKTLFNWIRQSLAGASCLDMFAGSGSLGFEAASQGAEQVVFLDSAAKTISVINKNIQLVDKAETKQLSAYLWEYPNNPVAEWQRPYDIIFIDPPFSTLALEECLDWLEEQQMLHTKSLIYIEMAKSSTWPSHQGFHTYKHASSGSVQFGLLIPQSEEKAHVKS